MGRGLGQGVGQGRGTAHLPSPLEAEREDSKAGRAGRARPRCMALCPRERLPLLPPSTIPVLPALRMDGMQLLLLTADQELVLTGYSMWWLNLATQSFRYAELMVTNFRVNSSTATLPINTNILQVYLRQKIIQKEPNQTMELTMNTASRIPGPWSSFHWKPQKAAITSAGSRQQQPSARVWHWNHGPEQSLRLLTGFLCIWTLLFTLTQALPFSFPWVQKQPMSKKKQFHQVFTSSAPEILRTTAVGT